MGIRSFFFSFLTPPLERDNLFITPRQMHPLLQNDNFLIIFFTRTSDRFASLERMFSCIIEEIPISTRRRKIQNSQKFYYYYCIELRKPCENLCKTVKVFSLINSGFTGIYIFSRVYHYAFYDFLLGHK